MYQSNSLPLARLQLLPFSHLVYAFLFKLIQTLKTWASEWTRGHSIYRIPDSLLYAQFSQLMPILGMIACTGRIVASVQ